MDARLIDQSKTRLHRVIQTWNYRYNSLRHLTITGEGFKPLGCWYNEIQHAFSWLSTRETHKVKRMIRNEVFLGLTTLIALKSQLTFPSTLYNDWWWFQTSRMLVRQDTTRFFVIVHTKIEYRKTPTRTAKVIIETGCVQRVKCFFENWSKNYQNSIICSLQLPVVWCLLLQIVFRKVLSDQA